MTAIELGARKAIIGELQSSQPNITEVCIAWRRDEERLVGRSTMNQIEINPQQTFKFLTRLLGLSHDD